MSDADIRFYFDPVCPFAWMTSKWVRMVAAQRDYTVDWRFISLRLINSAIDYDSHFPADYEEGHTSGLRLLRVAARARAEHGRAAVGPFYEAVSSEIFDSPGAATLTPATRGSRAFVEPLLAAAGLPADLADALGDTRWDEEIRAEGEEALGLTGRDVGTPIIQFGPPAGPAFFGPVISRLPDPDDAIRLWDYVTGLAAFPGFAELKRSLRERPQLRSFGVDAGAAGTEEDWHAGSRKTSGGLPALPLLHQELVGAHAVGVVVGDGGDQQFVGVGGVPELLELVRHLGRGADELGVDPVGDQLAVGVGPYVPARLLGGGEVDGALAGADAADPEAVAGRELPGGRLVVGDDDVGRDADVGAVQVGRGPERRPVPVDRLEHRRRADVVVGREPEAVRAAHLGALAAAAAEDPDLQLRALAGDGAPVLAVGRAVRSP
jgi:hypothetical protein